MNSDKYIKKITKKSISRKIKSISGTLKQYEEKLEKDSGSFVNIANFKCISLELEKHYKNFVFS